MPTFFEPPSGTLRGLEVTFPSARRDVQNLPFVLLDNDPGTARRPMGLVRKPGR